MEIIIGGNEAAGKKGGEKMEKYNQIAMEIIAQGIDDLSHNDIYNRIDTAIQPYEQRLVVVKQRSNGLADLQTIDNVGHICMAWHDAIRAACATCGQEMERYSRSGAQYVICAKCAHG